MGRFWTATGMGDDGSPALGDGQNINRSLGTLTKLTTPLRRV
jgi:hypothetical protein